MIAFSLSTVSADDLQLTDSGQVSGDVDVATANPFTTSGELTYDIPADAKEIKSADVYVNVYSGSASNNYGLNANVSLKTANGEKSIASEELWVEDGSTDGTIYPVNDHAYKCYSDYQMHYDITDSVKGLNGSSIAIKVNSFEMPGKSFDGRIKLIALILAYDDGDDDEIHYWFDATQKWTKTDIATSFNTSGVTDIVKAELTNIALSSADGTFRLNGQIMGDPARHVSGNYYQYNLWDVLDKIKQGQDTELISMVGGASSYGSLKNVLTFLKLESKNITADVSLASEYANTCYAGTNNTLTVNVNANFAGRYLIELLADGSVVNSTEVDLDGSNQIALLLTDQTVRPVDATTVNGANNKMATYCINVKLGDVIVGSANKTVPVLYNGNLGKDLAYDAKYIEDVQVFTVTGGIVTDTQNDSTYMTSSAMNRTDVFSIDLDNASSLEKAFVYIAYNWDKTGVNGPLLNVTFNGNAIAPKSSYRDQSNLGTYGNCGYGLFIYDVTDLAKIGENTLVLAKQSGLTAVYPSALIYLYNNTESEYIHTIYMSNGADLLSNSYNNAARIVKTGNVLKAKTDEVNATFSIFAAGAQKGEGNLIFNGNEFEDVWNGTSNSVEAYSFDVSDSLADSNEIGFIATGSTVLALNQILVTSQNAPVKVTLTAKALSTTYDSAKSFTVTAVDAKNNPVSGLEIALKIFTGDAFVTKTVKTNSNGIASFKDASKLAIGKHKVEISSSDETYNIKNATSSIKVAKAKTTVKAPKVTGKFKKSKYFKVTVKNKATNKAVKSIKVKLKIFTGKKYVTKTIKTNSKGVAQFNTKSLKVGSHKVIIYSGNSKYTISAKSTIVINK